MNEPGPGFTRPFPVLGPLTIVLGLLAGCAGTPENAAVPALGSPSSLPPVVKVANVPFFPQEEYYCGPAALATVLGWSGEAVDQDAVASEVYSPNRKGTLASDLIGAARRHGKLAVSVGTMPDLLRELAAGHPVLVFQNLGFGWYPIWHFAVVTGYDLESGDLTLHSGTDPRRSMSLERFERAWAGADRWALVVLPPDRLPASDDQAAVIQAAIGLERAGRPSAAAATYRAALNKWPTSFGAALGLGNALYATKDLAGAEQAFRRATMLNPNAAPAWNNLATVLAERNQIDPALYTARRAVETGGGAEPYRVTLHEIQNRAKPVRHPKGAPP